MPLVNKTVIEKEMRVKQHINKMSFLQLNSSFTYNLLPIYLDSMDFHAFVKTNEIYRLKSLAG